MRRHTIIGERILLAAPLARADRRTRALQPRALRRQPATPTRLSGEAIPLGSRIIAVCDAYDAMTSERPYRLAMTPEDALLELESGAGTQFDPDVVTAFSRVIGTREPVALA